MYYSPTDTMLGSGRRPVFDKAVAVFSESDIKGIIRFTDTKEGCLIDVKLQGVPDGKHGFHIHEKGDLSDGCKSAGPHYNPHNVTHAGLMYGHSGDLGNIYSQNKVVNQEILSRQLSVDEIIGRTIVLHEDEDDLGSGGDAESLKTGNAGKRIACAVIGIA